LTKTPAAKEAIPDNRSEVKKDDIRNRNPRCVRVQLVVGNLVKSINVNIPQISHLQYSSHNFKQKTISESSS